MPIKVGKPPRSPHDWLCRFCTTSAGNPYRNNGFRKECHRCHLAKGEAFKAKSENREQPTKSTKESARVVALEKELAQLRQAVKKPVEQSQQENDAPSRAAYKQAIQGLGKLVGVLPEDHPAIRTIRAELDQAKAASDESVPLSKRIRAGQNQIAMHERDLKAAKERVEEAERNLVSAQSGLEQSQAKAMEIEKALQERKAHLEQLHRQAAAEASRGPEATPLDAILPDDLTAHSPSTGHLELMSPFNESWTCIWNRAREPSRMQERQDPSREWMSMSLGNSMTRSSPEPKNESKLNLTSFCRLKRGVSLRSWRSCGLRWRGTSSPRCPRRDRSTGSAVCRRKAEISIVTVNANFWTTHREWMAREGPQHLVLGQEHRLEAARCDDESGKLEREGWRCGFTSAKRSAVRVKSESALATSAGTFVAAPKHWGLEWVWPTRGWQTKAMSAHQGRIAMAWTPILRGLTVFSVYFYHSEGWTERNQQLLGLLGDEVRRCAGLWVIGGDFNMEPEAFGQFATPARLPGILVAPAIPTFRHGASVRRFDYFVVHRAVACQIREVCVLEESGISPHHPVRMQLKRSFQGLVTRVQAVPRALPQPGVGCAREPWRWDTQRERSMDERWEWLMYCTECEILESADVVGVGARAHMGRGALPRWVTRKVVPQKAHNRPKPAADTRWWRILCNRLRELWLMEALPTRRPHLPQQPEQIQRLRRQLTLMAVQASTDSWSGEIMEAVTCTYGEDELRDLKDLHWRALETLDKLHKRDRRAREKEISRFAREASEGAAGLLHRITKSRAVWCPRDAAQGEATNPRDAADLAAKSWAVIWRTHDAEMQGADRPWEEPSVSDANELPQLEVEGPTGFAAVVSSFKPKTGIGVDAIHPSVWSRISDKGKQLFTDLLHDVELTLAWPAQIQTLIYFLVPKTPTGERPIGLMPSIVRVWERMRKPVMDQWLISQSRSYDWACKGRSAELAAWQHLVIEEGQVVSWARAGPQRC